MTAVDLADKHAPDRRRLGVALSGSGFRAGFFHVGVLAQLARLRLLRDVEVLSTVSGGSVVGALYYLHLKGLLESRSDSEIEDSDYLAVVHAVEQSLVAGAGRNLATLSLLNVGKNLRTIRSGYSRSDRMGELYDELFFRPAWEASNFGPPAPRPYEGPIQMRELTVRPAGAPHDFHPLHHNDSRAAKVPVLLVAATTLNTGHVWRFEATRMGEPPQAEDTLDSRSFADLDGPGDLVEDLDRNMRLRPISSYDELGVLHDWPLGFAVAASSAIPAVMPPLAITGLYPDVEVQLVDGAFADPQGVRGLLDYGCRRFVVSYGGRGLFDIHKPLTAASDLQTRAAAIALERLRSGELSRLRTVARDAPALLHLRKGLPTTAVPWISSAGVTDVVTRERRTALTCNDFDVDPTVQEVLSHVRTSLGSFTEVEASSLMLDGYQMSRPELAHLAQGREGGLDASWDFERLAPLVNKPTNEYLRQLRLASRRTGKLDVSLVLGYSVRSVAGFLALVAIALIVAFVQPWLVAVGLAVTALGIVAVTRSARTGGGRLVAGVIRFVVQVVSALCAPIVIVPLRAIDRAALRAGTLEWLLAHKGEAVVSEEEPAEPSAPRAIRSPRALVFVLAITAFAVGCLPLALVIGHLPLVGYLALECAVASFLSLRRTAITPGEAPSDGEIALGWAAAIFSGAVLSLIALGVSEAFRGGLFLVGAVVRLAGGDLRPDLDGPAFWTALGVSLVFGFAFAAQTSRGLVAKLFPAAPGARSAFHGLANGRGRYVAASLVVGAVTAAVLVVGSLVRWSWLGWFLDIYLLATTAWLWERGESAVPVPSNSRAVSALGDALMSAGFEVRTGISAGGSKANPLVEGIDLLATGHERTLAIEVKMGSGSAHKLDWTAASSLRIAASELTSDAGTPESPVAAQASVEPVLVLVGVEGDESLTDFAEQLDVTVVRFDDESDLAGGGEGGEPRRKLERALKLPAGPGEGGGDAAVR